MWILLRHCKPIAGNPDLLSPKELHKRALEIMKKIIRKEHLAETIDTDQTTKQGALKC